MRLRFPGAGSCLRIAFLAFLANCDLNTSFAAEQTAGAAMTPLSLDDLSILFPVPSRELDLDHVIAIKDVTSKTSETSAATPVFPADFFGQIMAGSSGSAGVVAGTAHRISLPSDLKTLDAWFIAGIRIDAGAPGLSPAVIDQFGQTPQIRLILQPVTKANAGALQVHDTAIHLIFNFTGDGLPPAQDHCFQRATPDVALFARMVADVGTLRDNLARGQFGPKITTAGLPLGVHPGLKDAAAAKPFRDALELFLERYLSSDRLIAMAIMAIPNGAPEPWMFLSFARIPPGLDPRLPQGGFVPVRGPMLDGTQFVEALSFQDAARVLPKPQNNNQNPITCRNEATAPPTLPPAERKGLATAELFAGKAPPAARVEEVADLVADPTKSHFFNTDCVSCHTETRRVMDLLHKTTFEHVDQSVLPRDVWNVRNFGWIPSFLRPGHVEATVTRRTANETQAVVDFVNTTMMSK